MDGRVACNVDCNLGVSDRVGLSADRARWPRVVEKTVVSDSSSFLTSTIGSGVSKSCLVGGAGSGLDGGRGIELSGLGGGARFGTDGLPELAAFSTRTDDDPADCSCE